MRVVILDGSPRKGGNTDMLSKAFADGASEHSSVDVVRVADLDIGPCIGCERCMRSEGNSCVIRDDMDRIYDLMTDADVLVIASPVYFYGISSQLKAVIDRFHTPMRQRFRIRGMALLLVGAADLPDLFDPIILQYRMALRFFNLEDLGSVLVRGIRGKGDIEGSPALEEASELGRTISLHGSGRSVIRSC